MVACYLVGNTTSWNHRKNPQFTIVWAVQLAYQMASWTLSTGAIETVNFICDNEDIGNISFVGSIKLANTFERGTNGKRVQANMGAKPCNCTTRCWQRGCINAIVGATFGAAGQRYGFVDMHFCWRGKFMDKRRRKSSWIESWNGMNPDSDLGLSSARQLRENP